MFIECYVLDTLLGAGDTVLIKGETCSHEAYINRGRHSQVKKYVCNIKWGNKCY